MLYDANNPEVYLDQLMDDWRKDILLELRQLILRTAPEVEEKIHYKMLGYGLHTSWLCHLNAQKHYVSLYLGGLDALDPDGSLLAGLNRGKGCLRFGKSSSAADPAIDILLERAVTRWRAGETSGCC